MCGYYKMLYLNTPPFNLLFHVVSCGDVLRKNGNSVTAVSVGASCFTLVAISLERYFAICRPLHSRAWQTLSHAYRCIVLTWVLAAGISAPVAVFQVNAVRLNEVFSTTSYRVVGYLLFTLRLDFSLATKSELYFSYSSVVENHLTSPCT